MPSGAGHRGVTICRCAVISFTVFLVLVTLAAFRWRHQSSVFAVGRKYAMKARQVGSQPGYQGCKACHEIQWLKDHVGSAIPKAFASLMGQAFSIRCLQLVANVAV
jgi:hypothetical protein